MLLFYVVVNFSVVMLTLSTYFALYAITKNSNYLFDSYIHGMAGYIAALTVAIKQIMPDWVICKICCGRELCCRDVPATLLCIVTCVNLLDFIEETYFVMFFWGLAVSWVYLRFWQKHPSGCRGDDSEHLSFVRYGQFHIILQFFSFFLIFLVYRMGLMSDELFKIPVRVFVSYVVIIHKISYMIYP